MSERKRLDPRRVAEGALRKATESQYAAARENFARLRRVHPDRTPADMIRAVDRWYVGGVTVTGAAAGSAAVVPNGGLQLTVAAVELGTFMEASVFYALTLCEIHGIDVEDYERRRAVIMAVLIGDQAAKAAVEPLLVRTAPYWGKKLTQAIPMSAINAANRVLGPRFITKYGTRQGILVLGKQLPAFIGVGIGAVGNGVFGAMIVRATRRLLGPAPEAWLAPWPRSATSDQPPRSEEGHHGGQDSDGDAPEEAVDPE